MSTSTTRPRQRCRVLCVRCISSHAAYGMHCICTSKVGLGPRVTPLLQLLLFFRLVGEDERTANPDGVALAALESSHDSTHFIFIIALGLAGLADLAGAVRIWSVLCHAIWWSTLYRLVCTAGPLSHSQRSYPLSSVTTTCRDFRPPYRPAHSPAHSYDCLFSSLLCFQCWRKVIGRLSDTHVSEASSLFSL